MKNETILRNGDQAWITEDGHFWITGRTGELVSALLDLLPEDQKKEKAGALYDAIEKQTGVASIIDSMCLNYRREKYGMVPVQKQGN